MYTDTSSSTTSSLILRIESGSHEPRTTQYSSLQIKWTIANNGHHCILMLLIGGRILSATATDVWNIVDWNGSLYSLMCISLQCTLCKRGQAEDRSISVQVWALTDWRLAYLLCYFCFYFLSLLLCVCSLSPTVCWIIWWWCVWMQPFVDCLIHFVVDIHI